MTTPLYSTRPWRKFRTAYLVTHPLCADCQARGITTMATEIDHIIPVRQGGAVWDDDNLQALCKPCHSVKTIVDGSRGEQRALKGCDVDGIPLDPKHPWRESSPPGTGGGVLG